MLSPQAETLLQALTRARQTSIEELLTDLLAKETAQQELLNAERFFDLALAPMCIGNADGYIIYINTAFEQLLGHTLEDWSKQPFVEFIHPEDRGYTERAVVELSAGQPKIDFINRYRTKSGEYRWISWVSTPQPNGYIYAVARDITREKELELRLKDQTRELHEHVRQLEAILDSQIDLVSRYDTEARLTFVNDAYCSYFGHKREDLLGKRFLFMAAPEYHAQILQRLEEIKVDPSPKVSVTGGMSEGKMHWVQWVDHGIVDEQGNVVAVQAVGRDITRLLIVEEELARKEKQYRLMFEHNPMPMWVFEPVSLGFMAVNEAAIQKYGYTREEFLNMTIKDIRQPEDVPRLLEDVMNNQSYGGGIYRRDQWQHRTKSGQIIDVEINAHDIVFDAKPARLVLVVDTTERKLLEKERLQQQMMQLEFDKERELNEQRERFFSMVSHEFKTPLTVIMSAANMIRDYYQRLSPQQVTERLSIVTDQAHEALKLIDDLLMIGRGQAGDLKPQLEPVDVVALCQVVIDNARIADSDRHSIRLDAPSSAMLNADGKMLRQIIDNLVTNALKYSEPQTVVIVSVTAQKDGIAIAVQDEGIGIPQQDIHRIFQAFARASNVRGHRGTGLGLAIVQQNVDIHGGQIVIDSKEGEGTRVTVKLPHR